MKRTIGLILPLLLLLPCLLLLASCGGEETPDEGPYTVAFVAGDRETTVTVERGETPVCPEEFLSWETAEHYYKVTGWDKEIVPAECDVTYTATVGEYGLTLYDVRFNMPSGMIGAPTHEGETPTPPAGYETDLSRVDKIGRFDHWICSVAEAGNDLLAPTAENMAGRKVMVYTPSYVYDETRYYTVTFVVGDAEYKVQTAGNKVPVCPVDPASAGDDAFRGWDKAVVKATSDATYTAWFGGSPAEILPAKDGAQAILTMTYDRNTTNPSESEWVLRMHDTYGIRGTNMLIVGRLNDTMTAGWKKNFARGTLDAGSLGMKHESARIETTQAIYRNEIVDSKYLVEKLFPDQNAICFASPYAQLRDFSYAEKPDGTPDKTQKIMDGGSKKIARETYYAVRNGTNGLNTLDPGCTENAGGWYNLKVQWTLNSQDSAQRLGWIDDAVKNKGWLLILAHSFSDSPSDETYTIPKTEARAFFAHASEYVKTGELWSASFVEATKYIRERQSATAYRKMENGVLRVGLKIDRVTPDGKPLDEDVFNYPLTVRTRVPAAWNTVSYELNGETVTATCYTVDGERYVNVNIVPGGDGAVASVPVSQTN